MPDPVLKKQKVTVLPNMDVSKVGHSDYINSVYPYLDGFRSIRVNGKATIHTHFRPGMITYKSGPFSNDAIILNIGPSDADYNGASNHIRHVMVDNRYIYLYTQDPKNTIIYKR